VVLSCDIVEALGEGHLLAHEPFLHLSSQLRQFVEDELDVGVHGTELRLLVAGVVDGVQGGTGLRRLIPLVSSS
jgi:hypothetical protein